MIVCFEPAGHAMITETDQTNTQLLAVQFQSCHVGRKTELRRRRLFTLHTLACAGNPNILPLDSDHDYRVLFSVLSTALTIPVNYTTLWVQLQWVDAGLSTIMITQVIQFLFNSQTRHWNNGKLKTSLGVWKPSMIVLKPMLIFPLSTVTVGSRTR